ncbi:hypothetical protein F5Y15DRAFT_23047, partial [Xylariaceae sp. FL0016]
ESSFPTTTHREGGETIGADIRSSGSHTEEPANYDRRPRRKTKEDKYDTKRKHSRKHERDSPSPNEQGSHRGKRSKKSKKKSLLVSKKVLNNFTSDAVLNGRITMQPPLRPGLFDNGRMSKKQPISDLSFSDMHFLKHQRQDSQPKAFSRRRQRERDRENRQLEEASSFFLPAKQESRTASKGYEECREVSPSDYYQDKCETPSARPNLTSSSHRVSSVSSDAGKQERLRRFSTVTETSPSKPTTYFTWSDSRQSSHSLVHGNDLGLYRAPSPRSETPDSVRKAIIATGVYRNTGIVPYDRLLTQETNIGSPIAGQGHNDHSLQGREDESLLEESSRDTSAPSEDEFGLLQRRWHSFMAHDRERDEILPARSQSLRQRTLCAMSRRPTPYKPTVAKQTGSKDYERDGYSEPLNRCPSQGDSASFKNPVQTFEPRSQPEQEIISPSKIAQQNIELQTPTSTGRISQTSREAMPPPPLPLRDPNPPPPEPSYPAPSNLNHAKKSGMPSALGITSHSTTSDWERNRPEPRNIYDIYNASNGTSIDLEGALSSLRSTSAGSWMLQTRTASSGSSRSENAVSRLSMRSPVYLAQLDDRRSTPTVQDAQPTWSSTGESMAEFIKRIESEARGEPSVEDDDLIQSELCLHDRFDEIQALDRQFPPRESSVVAENQQRDRSQNELHHVAFSQQSLGAGNVLEMSCASQGCTGHVPNFMNSNMTRPRPDNFESEEWDMSKFWRPNQYPTI